MNVNEEDFQKRLDEIGKLYEDGKDALNSMYLYVELDKIAVALEQLRKLRDIAAVAVKQAYQLKEN